MASAEAGAQRVVPEGTEVLTARTLRRERMVHRLKVWVLRIVVAGALILLWQSLPTLFPGRSSLADPFFISSPELVADRLGGLLFGIDGAPTIWEPFNQTILAAVIGSFGAAIVGAIGGLLLSEAPRVAQVAQPFLAFFNTIPRIAIIPIIIIIFGTDAVGSAMLAFSVVVFLAFYTAFAGSRSISRELLQNARILGASRFVILTRVRMPFVIGWTFGILPVAIASGLVGAVVGQVLTGAGGIGQLLVLALNTSDATLTFSLVVFLAVVGVIITQLAYASRRLLLPWWEDAH